MKITSAAATDIGRVRKKNQDSFICDDKMKLYVVADGIGGHKAGDVASKMATDFLAQIFLSTRRSFDPCVYLKQSIEEANRKIYDKAHSTPELSGMGTTLTVLYCSFDTATIAHVGDSRIYLVRERSIWQLSEDHSLVSDRFAVGQNTAMKNILTRSVGFDLEVEIDVYTKKLSSGDTFLICSDGLHGLIRNEEMATIVDSEPLEKAVQSLIGLANKRGGDDNITAVICRIERL